MNKSIEEIDRQIDALKKERIRLMESLVSRAAERANFSLLASELKPGDQIYRLDKIRWCEVTAISFRQKKKNLLVPVLEWVSVDGALYGYHALLKIFARDEEGKYIVIRRDE